MKRLYRRGVCELINGKNGRQILRQVYQKLPFPLFSRSCNVPFEVEFQNVIETGK